GGIFGDPLRATSAGKSSLAATGSVKGMARGARRPTLWRSLRPDTRGRLEPTRRRNEPGRLPFPERHYAALAGKGKTSRNVLDPWRGQYRRHRFERPV